MNHQNRVPRGASSGDQNAAHSRSRQPKGLRIGGQFMPDSHRAADVALASLGFVPDGSDDAEGVAPLSVAGPDGPAVVVDRDRWRPEGPDRHYDDGFVRMLVADNSDGTCMSGDRFVWSVAPAGGGEPGFGGADTLHDAMRQAEDAWGLARWGSTGVAVGDDTPSGRADNVVEVAAGITRVSNGTGGGWKLTDARNQSVPEILRNADGRYDEDQGWAKAAIVFPDEPGIAALNERMRRIDDRAAEDGITYAERVVRDHYPHGYEQVTGREVVPGQSQARDRGFTDRQKILHRMRYRPVTDDDRAAARRLYQQIGPVVAGNMDAKAWDVLTIPHGIVLQGCRSGRHRVDVSVREIGLGLREVTVFGPDGTKIGEATVSGQGGLQRAMLAVGDGDVQALIRLDRPIR